MRISRLFLIAFFHVAAAGLHAQGRRPPLPSDSVTAVSDGRPVRGVLLVQVEKIPCLSLRDVQRLAGGRVVWRRVARETSLQREGRSVDFKLDLAEAVVDGKKVALESPVRWWTGQAYIPLSFLLTPEFRDFAGASVEWEPSRKILAFTPIPDISSPRFTSQGDRVRVSFDLSPRVDYRVLRQDESGLLLRFFGGRAGARERLEVQNGLVGAVDILPRARSTDVMLSLGETAGPPYVTLQEAPRRLVVEVRAESAGPDPAPLEEVPSLLPAPAAGPAAPPMDEPSVGTSAAAPDPMDALSPIQVIVVDPGHGGKDAGAVGKKGTLEKDVNLVIARGLVKALRAAGRYEVHLTRDSDEFVSLQDRAEFANKKKADLFISVHCNAALSSKSNGFEVYFLSERATDEAAAGVARRENASIELEGPADKVQAKVAQLLWSLAKTETLNESSELAALVHKHAQKRLDVDSRGVKQAGFYVLKWAQMPAVLVESAFITNPREEGLLRSSRYVDKVAAAVVQGVKDYEKRKTQARLGKAGGVGGS
jgi:N-acetylmuramoyl-L-alanine amidase